MAKNSLVKYGIGIAAGWTVYNMAMNGSLGAAAQKAAQELSQAWTGSGGWHINSPSANTGTGSGGQQQTPSTTPKTQPVSNEPVNSWLSTSLRDFGGVPVLYNPATGMLKQDPNWVKQYAAPGNSPNSYSSGVFQTEDGQWFNYQGGGNFIPNDGGQQVSGQAFIVAV